MVIKSSGTLFFIPFIYLLHVCLWGSMCMPWYTHGGQKRTCRNYISPFTREPRDQTQVGQAWCWTLPPTELSCRPGVIFKYWLWPGSQHSCQLLGHNLAKQPRLVGWPRPRYRPVLPRAQGNESFRDICKRAVFFWFTELSFMPMVFWRGDLTFYSDYSFRISKYISVISSAVQMTHWSVVCDHGGVVGVGVEVGVRRNSKL